MIRPPAPSRWLPPVVTLVVVLAAWSAVSASGVVQPAYLAPSPLEVWDAFLRANTNHAVGGGVDRIVRGEEGYYLWEHLVVSLQRIGGGLALAIIVAVPLGLAMGTVGWFERVVGPYVDFLRSLPPLAYLGFLVAWFGIGDTSKVALLFLAAFPPIALATLNGGARDPRGPAERRPLPRGVAPPDDHHGRPARDAPRHPQRPAGRRRVRVDHRRGRGARQRTARHRGAWRTCRGRRTSSRSRWPASSSSA
ncbi:MAG: hypothetical protein PGN15_08950 [Aeromicrobium erythreum]